MTRHVNNGQCPKCAELFDLYPGFHEGLRAWFFRLQRGQPSAHISCAGRGRYLQEQYFKRGSSRAHFGESAHNFNAALDIFRLTINGAEYGPTWFREVVGRAVEEHNDGSKSFRIRWYGDARAKMDFFELPHCEIEGWRFLKLAPVEPLETTPNNKNVRTIPSIPKEAKKAVA